MRTHWMSNSLLPAALLAATLGGCSLGYRSEEGTAQLSKGVSAPRPSLAVEGPQYWSEGFDAAFLVALRNLHLPGSFHRTRHARAAPGIRGVHLWDSAFLSRVWNAWDVRTAQEVIVAVLDHAKDGRILHFSHRFFRSQLTQPPVIAWAAWENYLWTGDTVFLAAVYPALKAYDAWLYEQRQLPSGLFFWRAPFESGMDNSPRFDPQTTRAQRDLRTVAAVDFSSYMVLHSSMLSRMAGVLGHSGERDFYAHRATRLSDLINATLWDEATGHYYDRDEHTGELLKVRTAASFLPLFAGVPDSMRARRLRDHLMDPASFNSPVPLPTVALDDPSFSRDMWRGPVWINVSYMIIRGLDAYGFSDDAAQLAFNTIDGVFRTHQESARLWEFYDPERFDVARLQRKRGEILKRLTLGNKPLPDYGWSALVNTLLIEYLVGYRREGQQRSLAPRMPALTTGMRLQLTLPDEEIVIRLEVLEEGATRGEVVIGSERHPFVLAHGEVFPLQPSAYSQQHGIIPDGVGVAENAGEAVRYPVAGTDPGPRVRTAPDLLSGSRSSSYQNTNPWLRHRECWIRNAYDTPIARLPLHSSCRRIRLAPTQAGDR